MTTLTVQGTTPGAGSTMRSEKLIRSYGSDKVGWHQEVGNLQAIIDTVDRRMSAGDRFATPGDSRSIPMTSTNRTRWPTRSGRFPPGIDWNATLRWSTPGSLDHESTHSPVEAGAVEPPVVSRMLVTCAMGIA